MAADSPVNTSASDAPVLVQVYLLREVLDSVSRAHNNEPVVLVGHSAGGVIARTALVRGDAANVELGRGQSRPAARR